MRAIELTTYACQRVIVLEGAVAPTVRRIHLASEWARRDGSRGERGEWVREAIECVND